MDDRAPLTVPDKSGSPSAGHPEQAGPHGLVKNWTPCRGLLRGMNHWQNDAIRKVLPCRSLTPKQVPTSPEP